MERETIKLTNKQWCDVVWELYLEDANENQIELKEIERKYVDSSRHTEHHKLIFQRVLDGKYFKLAYETSVKDEMGWSECNYGNIEAAEVFPETITIIKYK